MKISRREFIKYAGAFAGVAAIKPSIVLAQNIDPINKAKIPKHAEKIPVIGMGTWITFNVGSNTSLRNARTKVLEEFFKRGGSLIDSSPMYGSAEEVVGYALEKLGKTKDAYAATKIWTSSTPEGVEQFKESQKLWKRQMIDLEQIHNFVKWKEHLKTLRKYKDEGKIKHIGITTSHGRRHSELEQIIKTEPLDFVQLTYNTQKREVEKKLLPLCQEKQIAVIANRPFEGGSLIKRAKKEKLPEWAKEFGAKTWAEVLLKYIISHPAMTCAIPATSKVEHMKENMSAGRGAMPTANQRKKIETLVSSW